MIGNCCACSGSGTKRRCGCCTAAFYGVEEELLFRTKKRDIHGFFGGDSSTNRELASCDKSRFDSHLPGKRLALST